MPKTFARVGGGGNAWFAVGLQNSTTKQTRIRFLASFTDTPGVALGQPTAVRGIGDPYALEIATPYGQQPGTIVLEVTPTWGKDGWVTAFMDIDGNSNLVDEAGVWNKFVTTSVADGGGGGSYPVYLYEVFKAQRINDDYIQFWKYELGNDGKIARAKQYIGATIVNITAGEKIVPETMINNVSIEIMYTRYIVTGV